MALGHSVTYYLPPGSDLSCTWMPCLGAIKEMPDGFEDDLDVILFNHEPQWFLLDMFERARLRCFYALHYGVVYDKPGSWECLRTPVDVLLANSEWTADMIEAEIGQRPRVLMGGINPVHFHPMPVEKEYQLLSVGDSREWKGQATIEKAAHIAGVELSEYSSKELDQEHMAEEYSKAEIFVVGSRHEGFGQPGLEALACGVPLVTTDNGGSREYAIDRETALVVPPDDPDAMARAITELREDEGLAHRLSRQGLELVEDRFSWERSALEFERVAEEAAQRRPVPRTRPDRLRLEWTAPETPRISVVTLAWDQLAHTQRCVDTVRRHTDVDYELIIVDQGSRWDAAAYAELAADVSVLNDTNMGFSGGFNQALKLCRGEYVAFLNNDTALPEGWASKLIETLESDSDVAAVFPAVTQANELAYVREEPGSETVKLEPFSSPPPAVALVMRTDTMRALGGWNEIYYPASGEDLDLAFTIWVNGLDIVFDPRVVVKHVSKGTASTKLPEWREVWKANRNVFFDRWGADTDDGIMALPDTSREVFLANRVIARAVIGWMKRFFDVRDRMELAELRRHKAAKQLKMVKRQTQRELTSAKKRTATLERDLNRRSVRAALRFAEMARPAIRAWRRATSKSS
ncbi:MAG: glycosyltransferase [Acidimicrobiia bacterium]